MPYSLDNDLDTIEDALTHLHRAASRHNVWEAVAKHSGVSIDRSGAVILHILTQHEAAPNCRLGTLANALGIEAPSLTRQIQQLEALGYVTRTPDPKDGRASVVRVTATGRHAAKQLAKAKRSYIGSVLGTWSASDRHELATLFHRLAEEMVIMNVKTVNKG